MKSCCIDNFFEWKSVGVRCEVFCLCFLFVC